jgi:hypothetical protein
MKHLEEQVLAEGELTGLVDRIAQRAVDPYTAADALLKRAMTNPKILKS